ncbi:Hypothetical predicted protein [Octopus vulgaris]|uniref:Uncharacterized protein n=1 Tax=Octopus vulgaris TaxID=6645 RepID=A0AA36FDX9_OCTVU|nr:Hypothetical predicted protein [Octopus vulgaris]
MNEWREKRNSLELKDAESPNIVKMVKLAGNKDWENQSHARHGRDNNGKREMVERKDIALIEKVTLSEVTTEDHYQKH